MCSKTKLSKRGLKTKCKLKHCHFCLETKYNFKQNDLRDPDPSWICFRCQEKCTCSKCPRHKSIKQTSEGHVELKQSDRSSYEQCHTLIRQFYYQNDYITSPNAYK